MAPTLVWGLGKKSGSASSVAQQLMVRTSSETIPFGVPARATTAQGLMAAACTAVASATQPHHRFE